MKDELPKYKAAHAGVDHKVKKMAIIAAGDSATHTWPDGSYFTQQAGQ